MVTLKLFDLSRPSRSIAINPFRKINPNLNEIFEVSRALIRDQMSPNERDDTRDTYLLSILIFYFRRRHAYFCSLPHVLSALLMSHKQLFAALRTEPEIVNHLRLVFNDDWDKDNSNFVDSLKSLRLRLEKFVSVDVYWTLCNGLLECEEQKSPDTMSLVVLLNADKVRSGIASIYRVIQQAFSNVVIDNQGSLEKYCETSEVLVPSFWKFPKDTLDDDDPMYDGDNLEEYEGDTQCKVGVLMSNGLKGVDIAIHPEEVSNRVESHLNVGETETSELGKPDDTPTTQKIGENETYRGVRLLRAGSGILIEDTWNEIALFHFKRILDESRDCIQTDAKLACILGIEDERKIFPDHFYYDEQTHEYKRLTSIEGDILPGVKGVRRDPETSTIVLERGYTEPVFTIGYFSFSEDYADASEKSSVRAAHLREKLLVIFEDKLQNFSEGSILEFLREAIDKSIKFRLANEGSHYFSLDVYDPQTRAREKGIVFIKDLTPDIRLKAESGLRSGGLLLNS